MNAVFTIWCTDNFKEETELDGLINSLKYFHPNIPVEVITTTPKEAGPLYEKHPMLMKSFSTLNLFDRYDTIVHMDADCTITGSLDEVFQDDYDVACVRNYAHDGSCGMTPAHECIIPVTGQTSDTYINSGFVSLKNKDVVRDWMSGPYKNTWDFDEQSELSRVVNSGKYRVKILDDHGAGVTYGTSSCWGVETHWDSWKDMYVESDVLYLNNRQGDKLKVKVLHLAGASWYRKSILKDKKMREWIYEWVSEDVKKYLQKIVA